MTISDEIAVIANQLANEGKTPSVALIKSQLNKAVPLPKIISVLKSWQHEPTFIKTQGKATKDSADVKPDNQTINLQIAAAIAPLQQEISELKQLIKHLLDSQQIKK